MAFRSLSRSSQARNVVNSWKNGRWIPASQAPFSNPRPAAAEQVDRRSSFLSGYSGSHTKQDPSAANPLLAHAGIRRFSSVETPKERDQLNSKSGGNGRFQDPGEWCLLGVVYASHLYSRVLRKQSIPPPIQGAMTAFSALLIFRCCESIVL